MFVSIHQQCQVYFILPLSRDTFHCHISRHMDPNPFHETELGCISLNPFTHPRQTVRAFVVSWSTQREEDFSATLAFHMILLPHCHTSRDSSQPQCPMFQKPPATLVTMRRTSARPGNGSGMPPCANLCVNFMFTN